MLAHYEPNSGQILGFYVPEIHKQIPEPTVEIDRDTWRDHLEGAAPKSVDVATGQLVDFVPPVKSEAEILADREAAARVECRRRIYAEADAETQMNMATAAAVAAATPTETASADLLASVGAALGWVAAMRAAWPVLAADFEADIHADASWPDCPAEVRALAAQY
jgi:hypothetical protein